MTEKILYKELSYRVVGCIYEVYNTIGSGFKESIYRNALKVEFKDKNIDFEDQPRLPITYKLKRIGVYLPDFVVADKIILELKSAEFMPKYNLGYIVNFGGSKIDIR